MSAASEQQRTTSAERLVFFTDAVVAIAMTLLILPLLEAVSDATASGVDTAEYVSEHSDKLIAFALSFFIIGLFWRAHERLYARVERQDAGLFRLNMLWMFTIVWLPVATALVGSMATDPLQLTLYIGTMLVNSLVMLGMVAWLRWRPGLLKAGSAIDGDSMEAAVVTCVLFAVALLLALAVPGVEFWALLVLLLRAPIEWGRRKWGRGPGITE